MVEKRGKSNRNIILVLLLFGAGSICGACSYGSLKPSICEVQGKGELSEITGKKVTLEGVVSAVLEDSIPSGFFLVDQNCSVDDGGSRGIFVEVASLGDFVHQGDEVRVRGLVEEVGAETRIRCDQSEIETLSLGNDLPPGIDITEEFFLHPTSFEYENWEGVLVTIPEGEYQGGFLYSELPRIRPVFNFDPGVQMVCLQNESMTLQLSSSWEFHRLDNLSIGDLVQNLSGIIRQNTTGYILELIPGTVLKQVRRNGSQGFTMGNTFAEFDISKTQELFSSGTPEVEPSRTSTITLIPSATIIPSLTYYPVNILISEFYPNPTSKEPDGEWVEIYNPEGYAQPLTGIKLGDETSPTGKEGMLRFPDGYYIESQEVLVIANQAKTFFSEFGFLPDFEMKDSDSRIPDLLPYGGWGKSGVQFSNNGDEVLLLDPWDGIVDLLAYGKSNAAGFSGPPPAPKEGHSLERYPPDGDRDRGGDWREREMVSPGRLDRSPPTQVNEPSLEPTSTITPSPQVAPSETASLAPTRSATIAMIVSSTPTAETNPSLSPSPSMTNTISVTPGLILTPMISPSPTQSLTEIVCVTQTPTIRVESSLTATLDLTISPTANETAISEVTPTRTEVLTETPQPSLTYSWTQTVTETVVSVEDLEILLNEIHADPDLILGDANNDGLVHSDDDEFLEFVNIGEVDLDLSGWSVSDSLKVRYIFPDGTDLKSGCAVVVFGGDGQQGDFGGSLVFSAGSLGLNNAGDSITLSDRSGDEKLYYEYGSEGGENQSLTRSPDIRGVLPLILHSLAVGSNGDLYSPGFTVEGKGFGICP